MAHELPDKSEILVVQNVVERMAQRSRQLVFVRAVCIFVSLLLSGIALLATVDYLLQLRSPFVVWFQFALFIALLLVTVAKIIVPAERYRPSLVEVARRLEVAFPQLHQRLSTVCDLYERKCELSPVQLQFLNGLAVEVSEDVSRLELERCFRPHTLLRPVLSATVVLLLIVSMLISSPQQVATATQRVVMPWSGQYWPREFELRVIDYRTQAAEGGDYLIEIINLNGSLPDDLSLEILWESAETSEQIRLFQTGRVTEYRLNDLLESFKFRLHGGDFHDIGWNKVAVVAAPVVSDFQLMLKPPEYTGLDPYLADHQGNALPQSYLSFRAVLDNPIETAKLIWDVAGHHTRHPLVVARDGEGVGVTIDDLEVNTSGLFWLEFEDANGVVSQTREVWRIDVLEDQLPKLHVRKPSEDTLLTVTGVVPVSVHITDDLRVESLEVVIQNKGAENQKGLRIPLDLEKVFVGARPVFDTNRIFVVQQPDSIQVECGLDVSSLPSFAVGAELSLSFRATDQFGNQATSETVHLSVSSDRELRGRLTRELEDVQIRFRILQRLLDDSLKTLGLLQSVSDSDLEVSKLLHQLSLEAANMNGVLSGGSNSILTRLEVIDVGLSLTKVKAPLISESLARLEELAVTIQSKHLQPLQTGIYQVRNNRRTDNQKWLSDMEVIQGYVQLAVKLIDSVLGAQSSAQSQAEFESSWKGLLGKQIDLRSQTSGRSASILTNEGFQLDTTLNELAGRQLSLASDVFQLVDQTIAEEQLAISLPVQELAAVVVSEMRQVAAKIRKREITRVLNQQEYIVQIMQRVLFELGIELEEDLQTTDQQYRVFVERLKSLHRQQVVLMGMDLTSQVAYSLLERQRQLADVATELSQQAFVSPLLQIGLQDVAISQNKAAELMVSGTRGGVKFQQEAVEMLETMIGVAADGSAALQDDKDGNRKSATVNSELLSLLRIMQKRLHANVNPLVKKTELSQEEKQQLNSLIQHQTRIIEAIKQMQMTKEDAGNE